MIITSAEFVTSAVRQSHYPPPHLPEIAFAGRSNVGKSSLINTLVNRKKLVKTSSTPGRTQLINFFNINQSLMFVDLPGFGYARVPEKIQKEWGPMIETYLSTRSTLKGVVLIMDLRRTPGRQELDLINWLYHYGIPCLPVMTKTDKLKKSKQTLQQKQAADALQIDPEDLLLFSAKSRQGKEQVWDEISRLIQDKPPDH
ncbi:MAG: ribosome biogenesis GTP-binding protein YihA/YsxC [Desulfobacterales bacterium]